MKLHKLWYLYDFANSFASAVIIFYLPLIIMEQGFGDHWIGIAAAVSTATLLLFYPYFGRKSDVDHSKRMKYIRTSSFLMVSALTSLAFLTNSQITEIGLVVLLLLYVVFQVSFQGSYVFYSSQMNEISSSSTHKNKVSSIGMGIGQLGNAVAIGGAGFLIASQFNFLGIEGKSAMLLMGALIFSFLATPYLFSRQWSTLKEDISVKLSFKRAKEMFFQDRRITLFLIGYMLIADSIFTLQVYLSLYFKNVFGLGDKDISIIGGISLLSLFLTCLCVGFLAHKIKSQKKVILFAAGMYILSFTNLAFAPNNYGYIVASLVFAGIAYGLFFPLARSYYSEIIPKNSQAEFFSFFVIFERAATIIGPLLFISVLYAANSFDNAIQYRAGVFLLAIISVLGFFFLRKSLKIISN